MSDDIAIHANELGQRAALSGEEQEALQRLLCSFPRAALAVLLQHWPLFYPTAEWRCKLMLMLLD